MARPQSELSLAQKTGSAMVSLLLPKQKKEEAKDKNDGWRQSSRKNGPSQATASTSTENLNTASFNTVNTKIPSFIKCITNVINFSACLTKCCF